MSGEPLGQFRVCLISPPFDREQVYATMGFAAPIEPPLGLAFIASTLRSKGFSVGLIDSSTLGWGLDDLERLLRDWRPHVVGVSANSPVYPISVRVADCAKRVIPEATTVLGGCHPTLYPQRAISNKSVDAVVVGEGEHAMAELCVALAEGKGLHGVPGIVHKSGGQIVFERERPFLEDLDVLPFPSFDLLPMSKYRVSLGMARRIPSVSMVASRGCPFNCKFCTSPGVWKRRWRHHSAEYVGEVAEVMVKRHGVQHIQFRDDTFTVDQDWVLAICDEFERRGLRATWDCYSTVGLIREQMVRRMKRAGCTCLSIGIESGNDEMLQKYKSTSKDEVRQNIALLRRIGMRARMFFMLAPPAERYEHLQETLEFALELDPDFAMFLPTVPLPGSALYDELQSHQCGAPDYDHQCHNFQQVLYAPPPFTIDELEAFRSLCYRRFYFRPSYVLRVLPNLLTSDAIQRLWEAMHQFPAFVRQTWIRAKAKGKCESC